MKNCININHPDVTILASELNLPKIVVAAKIGVWQEEHNILDRFPTTEELFTNSIINKNIVKPGVQELFDSNSELAQIGTPEQYSQYLDSIFPDSKVKDIVYHVGYNNIEKFIKRENGIYFTDNLDYAKNLIIEKIKSDSLYAGVEITTEEAEKQLKKYIVILNSKNILKIPKVNSQIIKDLNKENFDTIKGVEDKSQNIESYVVFEPEQIHILSSKKDFEMFRNFINFTKSEYAKYGDIQQFKDYIMSKNFAAIEEFLVVNNKIDRKC